MGQPQGKQDQGDGRRQGEPGPGCRRAPVTCAGQAQRDTDLAAGRAWEELAQRDQFGIAALAEPAAAGDELLAKITQVRNRPAEGGEAQAQEDQEH